MGKYALMCKECKEGFPSYEKYEVHIYTTHKDKLYLRLTRDKAFINWFSI